MASHFEVDVSETSETKKIMIQLSSPTYALSVKAVAKAVLYLMEQQFAVACYQQIRFDFL